LLTVTLLVSGRDGKGAGIDGRAAADAAVACETEFAGAVLGERAEPSCRRRKCRESWSKITAALVRDGALQALARPCKVPAETVVPVL